MNLPITQHNPDFATAPQIQAEHIPHMAQHGFKTIINHRPDGEMPNQPTHEHLAAAATIADLHCHHLPVIRGQYSPEQIAQMANLLKCAPKPILSFCGSGARASELYALAAAHLAHNDANDANDDNDA